MALINCKECGKEISSQASVCPNCGCPVTSDLEDKISRAIEYFEVKEDLYKEEVRLNKVIKKTESSSKNRKIISLIAFIVLTGLSILLSNACTLNYTYGSFRLIFYNVYHYVFTFGWQILLLFVLYFSIKERTKKRKILVGVFGSCTILIMGLHLKGVISGIISVAKKEVSTFGDPDDYIRDETIYAVFISLIIISTLIVLINYLFGKINGYFVSIVLLIIISIFLIRMWIQDFISISDYSYNKYIWDSLGEYLFMIIKLVLNYIVYPLVYILDIIFMYLFGFPKKKLSEDNRAKLENVHNDLLNYYNGFEDKDISFELSSPDELRKLKTIVISQKIKDFNNALNVLNKQ